ncbi:sigma-70 region 4 domain-containing protein [Sphingobacterium sp. arapr2]|uniref:RNA polymerase sigma factor n=1 Tax=Sphingobacterium prati TaxID=2737006 RepID=UPI001552F397|nr:sigma-70 region 4 domain-containing protein [Sphingobacterium prati]
MFSLVSLGLPGRQKEILYLKYVKGLSFEEIAQTIGVTLKASYNYIQELFNPLGIILATQVTQLHSSFAFILRKHNIEMDYLTN